jgi:hypothetical protein
MYATPGNRERPTSFRPAPTTVDPIPVVKLFTPGGYARYLLTEIDPTDSDPAYGCDLGIGFPD